jgi:diketogulonate reductase-like aldo/keto reductase
MHASPLGRFLLRRREQQVAPREEHQRASDLLEEARKSWIVPIPGITKLHRLEENLGAASIELMPDDLREIDSAASRITVQGDRYPKHLERMSGR